MGNKQSNKQSYRRRAFTTVGEDEDSEFSDDDAPQSSHRMFKVLLLGDHGTGKTSFASSIQKEEFSSIYNMTIGVSFVSCITSLDNKTITTQMFDSPGHVRYRDFIRPYYRDTMGVFIFFDVMEEQTFLSISRWLKEVMNHSLPNVPIILLGNKCDLAATGKRSITYKRAKEFADKENLPYIEISCKDRSNVEFAHVSLLALIKKRTRDIASVQNNNFLLKIP